MKSIYLILLFLLGTSSLSAQDFGWWNDTHNWDGVTRWRDYIIVAPDFMGPNALPVPTIHKGKIADQAYFKLGAVKHSSPGDKTENLSSELFIPLFSPRVGLSLGMVPIERYKTDAVTRDRRRARNFSGEGTAVGDLYIGTHIQLLQDKVSLPDVLLTVNLKTASGNKLSDARHTDAPGYFFDLSFGKQINLNKRKTSFIHPYAMLGFYVWQLRGAEQEQNDAFLFGAGCSLLFPKVDINTNFGGYYGYLGNGDKPLVYRLILSSKFDSVFNYELGFQKGLQDYDFTSISVSWITNLSKLRSG